MTGPATPRRDDDAGHVRLVTVDQAIAEARVKLDDYEARYGVPSDRRHEAFVDGDGHLRETGEYLQWSATLERLEQLTTRAAS